MPKSQKNSANLANGTAEYFAYQELITLAENTFIYTNMPEIITPYYYDTALIRNGSIVFFVDDVLGLLALPYEVYSTPNLEEEPTRVVAIGANGYRSRVLEPDEFVIMYDCKNRINMSALALYYATRIAICERVADVNIHQQRTNRFFKCATGNETTVKSQVNSVIRNEEVIVTYNEPDISETTAILAPAPFVADKVKEHQAILRQEFTRLCGISTINQVKKERYISDEVLMLQANVIPYRYNRYTSREYALNEVKRKFGYDIGCSFMDGFPTNLQRESEILPYSEETENV